VTAAPQPAWKRRTAIAAALAAIAAPFEGLRQVAYYDPPGILTVCYGHTGSVDATKVYTKDECKALLEKDTLTAIDAVERCQPGLPDNVLVAFGDAVFNIGPRVACDRNASTAARLLAAKRYADACRELPKWNKARVAGQLVELPGLTKRRYAEMNYCLKGLA
jgi:lysozyme